jgi:hypothetical protein
VIPAMGRDFLAGMALFGPYAVNQLNAVNLLSLLYLLEQDIRSDVSI